MAASLSREFLLVAACCIWPRSNVRTRSILESSAYSLDWNRFLRVVARHSVVGLVRDGLISAGIQVPQHIADKLADQASTLVRENLKLAAEAVRLQRLFSEADLPLLFVKGPPLAALAFGNLGLRQSKDLDLLVPAASLSAAVALLENAGYRRFEPAATITGAQLQLLMPIRKNFGYVHTESRVEIELHWRLFTNPYFMTENTIMDSSRAVPVSAQRMLRTLGDDDLFAYLCAHGAQHWWYQLKWLADIGALLARAPSGDMERLYQAAEARGVGKSAAQAILLCQFLLKTTVPDPLLTTFRKNRILRWLEATALKAMTTANSEVEPRNVMFGTTRGSLSTFLLSQNSSYWLTELKNHLICQEDILTIAIPERLHYLYPALRLPLWLWRHSRHCSRPPR